MYIYISLKGRKVSLIPKPKAIIAEQIVGMQEIT